MNSLKVEKNICRICLENGVLLNWNEEILEFSELSYKYCYYKYTKLEEIDPDPYPISLCNKCAEQLRNAHILFEKALESFKTLGKLYKKYPDPGEGTSRIGDNLIQTERDKLDVKEISIVEPTYFIDIQNLCMSDETPLELLHSDASNLRSTRKVRRKRNNREVTLSSALKQSEPCDAKSLSTIKKTRKRSNCKNSTEDVKISESCEYDKIQSKEIEQAEGSLESREAAKKPKERNLLMCSYCSLKVKGAKKLEKHEATHNENRERTVVCPECGLKLYTDWSLNMHMKVHDTNRQKNHKCEFCEKSFFNKGALNIHKRIHLGLMIKCQICEKEFFRQIDLDKHLLKHSSSPLGKNVRKKKYAAKCQYCNKSVFTENLKEHIAVHLDQPQVKCKICDKNFYSRVKCTRHLRRFHLKNISEYEDFIHYHVDRNTRLSSLMIKQQLVVQPLN